MSYQAVLEAAQALYAAMITLEQELSSQPPDANVQRQALQLSVTRLTIQKLLGVYPVVATVQPSAALWHVDSQTAVVFDAPPSDAVLPSAETSIDKPAVLPLRRAPKGRR